MLVSHTHVIPRSSSLNGSNESLDYYFYPKANPIRIIADDSGGSTIPLSDTHEQYEQ